MHDNTIALVKSMTVGGCTCYEVGGSCFFGSDPETGQPTFGSTPGTKIQCMRCKARAALDADGVEYEKVDHVPHSWFNSVGRN
jgi:hypothetical protein